MENLKKAMIIRNGNVVGAVGDKNFSTLHIGCVIPFAGNTDNIPRGYLLADGASYPTVEYPDLYAVIGNTYGGDSTNFNVPDYRETVLVGVGENTTDTIADHDVYELGEFKDDQLQNHTHSINTGVNTNGSYIRQVGTYAGAEYSTTSSTISSGRKGTTTHGKQKGVTYIIKAFHTNEGTDSGVSDDVVEYVDGELSTKKDVAKLLNNATDSTKWIKLKLGNSSTFQPIIISDQYGGKIEITGMANDGTYKSVKLVRCSYGDWTTHNATSFTTTSAGDGNYKIRRLYYYPTDGYYYLEIRQWATIKVEGNSTAEMVTSLPAETSAMTLIPESNWGRIDDTSTGSTSTWSSSKIAQQDGIKQVYTASATAYPVNFWILSDDTSGVFWFKHTFSREDTVKMVEGYANLTNDTVIITTNVGEVGSRIGTDSISGKKGVIIGIQMQTGDVKITEARPITATPTLITPR